MDLLSSEFIAGVGIPAAALFYVLMRIEPSLKKLSESHMELSVGIRELAVAVSSCPKKK